MKASVRMECVKPGEEFEIEEGERVVNVVDEANRLYVYIVKGAET